MSQQCKFIRDNNGKCNGYAVVGSEYCFSHDPNLAEEKLAAVTKGGRNSKKVEVVNILDHPVSLRTPEDLIVFSERMVNDILSGKMDPRMTLVLEPFLRQINLAHKTMLDMCHWPLLQRDINNLKSIEEKLPVNNDPEWLDLFEQFSKLDPNIKSFILGAIHDIMDESGSNDSNPKDKTTHKQDTSGDTGTEKLGEDNILETTQESSSSLSESFVTTSDSSNTLEPVLAFKPEATMENSGLEVPSMSQPINTERIQQVDQPLTENNSDSVPEIKIM